MAALGPALAAVAGRTLRAVASRLWRVRTGSTIGAASSQWEEDFVSATGRTHLAMRGLLVAVALVGGSLTPAAQAAFPGRDGLVAFEGYGPELGTYAVAPDGSGLQQLLSGGIVPTWSPDGLQLAFSDDDSGGAFQAFTARPGGADRTQLTHAVYDDAGSFSPDGSRLAVTHCDTPHGPCHLGVVNSDGSGEHVISDLGPGGIAWSPQGTSIAFVSGGFAYTIDPDGSGLQQVAAVGGGLDWSPDGTRLALTAPGGGIVSVRPDGSDRQTLDGNASDGSPVWSPDGTQLAFVRDGTLMAMGVDGSHPRVLATPAQGFFCCATWQPLISDTHPPTQPTGLAVQQLSPFAVVLRWTASSDDHPFVTYQVLRDGALIGSPADPSWDDQGVAANEHHVYAVRAVDAFGNLSPISEPLAVDTPGPPTGSLSLPDLVGPTSATLHGTVAQHGGTSTSAFFEIGTTTAYGQGWSAGLVTADGPVSATVIQLAPGTTYHYRLHVVGSWGQFESPDAILRTPQVTLGGAASVGPVSATLDGRVDPGDQTLAYVLQIRGSGAKVWLTRARGEASAQVVLLHTQVLGLLPGQTYDTRLVLQTQVGPAEADGPSFTTPLDRRAPRIVLPAGACARTPGRAACHRASAWRTVSLGASDDATGVAAVQFRLRGRAAAGCVGDIAGRLRRQPCAAAAPWLVARHRGSRYVAALPALPPGRYTLDVRAIDRASNAKAERVALVIRA